MADIRSSSILPPHLAPYWERTQPFGPEQEETVRGILAGHDPNALTERSKQDINAALRQAGIEPDAALARILEQQGFDAGQLAPLARPPGETDEDDPAQAERRAHILDALIEVLRPYDVERLSDDDLDRITQEMIARGFPPPPDGRYIKARA